MIRAKRFPSGARLRPRQQYVINPWGLAFWVSLLLWGAITYVAWVAML